MSTHDQDKLEQELDALKRQYRATAADEPPALLDQAVLNRARRAAERHPTQPWNFGWMHATATAALVVLGLTLVLQLRESVQAPKLQQDARQPAERSDVAEEQDMAVSTLEDFRQREAEALEQRQSAQKSELLREPREEAMRPAAPAPLATPPVIIIRPVPAGWERETMADRSAAAAAAEPADEAADADAVGQAQQRVVTPGGGGADADAWEFSGDTLVLASPEEWLAWIIELKQAGLEQAWRSELDAFREAFPERPVPEALLATELEDADPAPQDP